MWIGQGDEYGFSDYTVGQEGFLVQRSNPYQRRESWELSNVPAHTNGSHMPRLHGWCGETDNVSVYAHGVARVTRVAKNGRALVEVVTDAADIARILDAFGYPELTD